MSRTTEQNEALREATRLAVQTAGVRVFARHGFAAANMRRIAAEAGLSVGSIYRHYASKEELFDALIVQACAGLESAAAQLDASRDAIAPLRHFTEAHVASLAAHDGAAEFTMVMNQCAMTRTPAAAASRLIASQRVLWRAVTALIRRGQNDATIAAGDAAQMTAHYFAMLTGITSMRIALDEPIEADVDLILRMFVPAHSPNPAPDTTTEE